MSVRARGFCFTWNNYPEDLAVLDTLEARYIVYGKELAPSTGTPHLQGYVYWDNARTVGALRRRLPGVHVVVARGTATQNRDYCTKGGDFVENGSIPEPDSVGRNESDRWDNAWSLAKAGDIESIPADLRVRYYGAFTRIAQDYMPRAVALESTCGTWIHGLSGAGKTRAVLSAFPDAYIKPRNQWWDGYQNEPVVLLDDVDKFDRALGGKLKHWADFAPFIAERKGGSIRIRPRRLIVTSQYRIEDIWDDEETLCALRRRFNVIEKVGDQSIILL